MTPVLFKVTQRERARHLINESLNFADMNNLKHPDHQRKQPLDFESFKLAYPKRSGSQPWRRAIRAANARSNEGATFDAMIYGARRYADFCEAIDNTGTQYVMQAATFLGPEQHFLEAWDPPLSKSEKLHQRNRQHAIDFLERDKNDSRCPWAVENQ